MDDLLNWLWMSDMFFFHYFTGGGGVFWLYPGILVHISQIKYRIRTLLFLVVSVFVFVFSFTIKVEDFSMKCAYNNGLSSLYIRTFLLFYWRHILGHILNPDAVCLRFKSLVPSLPDTPKYCVPQTALGFSQIQECQA